jgi:N-formylglutamate amidohydrolase
MDDRYLERIPRISWAEFKKNLAERKPFEAISPMGTALFRVKRYEPSVVVAAHAGHRVRDELLTKMAIEEADRAYEEDTSVDEIAAELPVQMIALDSRYEYDANRIREQAVYLKPFQSWGKKVWQVPPTKEELEICYQKHDEFQEMLDHLVEQISGLTGRALVIDLHSYNHRRPAQQIRSEAMPTFNLATSAHDQQKHRKALDALAGELRAIDLPGGVTVKENAVFKKDGALATALEPKYPESLVVPIEVKKIYMDETTGEVFPDLVARLRRGLGLVHQAVVPAHFAK